MCRYVCVGMCVWVFYMYIYIYIYIYFVCVCVCVCVCVDFVSSTTTATHPSHTHHSPTHPQLQPHTPHIRIISRLSYLPTLLGPQPGLDPLGRRLALRLQLRHLILGLLVMDGTHSIHSFITLTLTPDFRLWMARTASIIHSPMLAPHYIPLPQQAQTKKTTLTVAASRSYRTCTSLLLLLLLLLPLLPSSSHDADAALVRRKARCHRRRRRRRRSGWRWVSTRLFTPIHWKIHTYTETTPPPHTHHHHHLPPPPFLLVFTLPSAIHEPTPFYRGTTCISDSPAPVLPPPSPLQSKSSHAFFLPWRPPAPHGKRSLLPPKPPPPPSQLSFTLASASATS